MPRIQTLYLAGPMTGKPSFNIPAFDAAAEKLRGRGFTVISPAELDDPETRKQQVASATGSLADLPPGDTWGMFLARDIKLIADDGIEGLVVLDGWDKSRGARLETFVGNALCGLPVFEMHEHFLDGGIDHLGLHLVPYLRLVRAWAQKPDLSFYSQWDEQAHRDFLATVVAS